MADVQPMDPTGAFAQLGRIKLSETDIDSVLAQVADVAKRTIPGASEVSVTLVRGGGGAHSAAFTGELALTLDEWQYEHGHGPCLDAAASTATLSVPDMTAERRWPDWAHRAIKAGANCSLSIGLPIGESVSGALNVYATERDAFDEDAIILAQTFSGYAAVALANAHLYDAKATLAQHMEAAMESRAVIEQAKGIIMGERRCSPDEAFAILAKVSQDANRKLRDVATALVTRAMGTPKEQDRP
jgi:GAF domain-containing protein